eukprot:TRINITY_DN812_c0_g2_i1.p1 TRINITY_DN812_c0_g2~~TRINITY_DN812_c0_g2_i1.p1  ORF type:complete len:225 (+),score=68.44 TRINITY_DN812_c0_g2_i1:94-768(+)
MLSKLMTTGKELLIRQIKSARFKKLDHYETHWDKFLTDKMQFIGFKNKAAYAFALLNVLGFVIYQSMYNKDNYFRRFAYEPKSNNKLSKYFTFHFANTSPIIFGLSLPPYLFFARRLEVLYGTAFLIKLTFLSICSQMLTFRMARMYEHRLPAKLKLPLDQTSKDGKYTVGIHGMLATYFSFYVFKRFPRAFLVVPVLALADALLSQNGFWGGYLAGYLALLMF